MSVRMFVHMFIHIFVHVSLHIVATCLEDAVARVDETCAIRFFLPVPSKPAQCQHSNQGFFVKKCWPHTETTSGMRRAKQNSHDSIVGLGVGLGG